ncbi:right-handed parallel beta-helix repeat-containing protein [Candidatus Sumerlaeota bacterium]|nr:right-handed parallel beta-helix repeat-containing protein [Candidatus Sumerlaeota bacterium]
MRRPRTHPRIGLALALTIPLIHSQAATLELCGTFNSMGVIVTLEGTDDPDRDAAADVEWRTGVEPYRAGFPLTRVADTRFVGSLFWLEPDTACDVRVTLSDPDGGPIDGVALELTASTRAEIVIPPAVNSYHVATDGNDTEGDGSPGAPFATVARALAEAQPGDEVVLRGGVYHQGEIDIPRSGQPGAPIVIRGFTGETAVLDGGDPMTFSWIAEGGGVYRATVNAPDTYLVAADGERLYPYQSLSDLQDLVWGIPGFHASDTEVRVRLAADADPNTAEMMVSRFNHAFRVGLSHIFFLDLTLRHFGQGSYAKAIYLDGADDCLVQGCTFFMCDLGIGLKREAHRNVIQDCDFSDTVFDWPWDAVKTGSSLETGGIRLYDPMTGRGTVIRRNTFHDLFDGFGVCPGETAALTNETDVHDNLIHHCGDDGVEVDGRSSNVRLWGNTFHDVLVGISVAPVYTGPTYAIRNVIHRIGAGNSCYSGTAFKFNSGYDTSGPIYLFHNTCDALYPGNTALDIKSPGTWEIIVSRNNIWSGTEYALSNANTSQPLDLDHDNLFTTLPGELAWWAGLSDRHLNTLAEIQSATGQEMSGFNLAPGFTDAAGEAYTLSADSEMIDRGTLIPGINDDFEGDAPDLGAHEWVDVSGVSIIHR